VTRTRSVALDTAVEAVQLAPAGKMLAALTELGRLSLLDCTGELRHLDSIETGLQSGELAFSPDGSQLAVTGIRQREVVEGVVLVYPVPPSAAPAIPAAVFDTMATAPTFVSGAPPMLVVGSYLRLVCLDPVTFKELGSADGDDYIAPRGLVSLKDRHGCVAVWGRQGFSRVHWYDLTASGPVARNKGGKKEPESLGGIAVSPSGARVAATFARPEELVVADPAATEGPYGHVSVYDNAKRALIVKHPIPGSLERDFAGYDGDAADRRRAYGAERPPTRPIFVDEDHCAVGLPGGDVRVVELKTGGVDLKWRLGFRLTTLDYSQASGLWAAGGPDGWVHVWAP